MMIPRGKAGFRSGFSLLELVVALLIFQVGLLAVAGMVFQAQTNIRRSELIMRGTLEALRKGDSILAEGGLEEGQVQEAWGTVSWGSRREETSGLRVWTLDPVNGDTTAFLWLWPWDDTENLFGPAASGLPGMAPVGKQGGGP